MGNGVQSQGLFLTIGSDRGSESVCMYVCAIKTMSNTGSIVLRNTPHSVIVLAPLFSSVLE